MILLLNHPEVAYRTCEDCKQWMYDPQGRQVRKLQVDPADGKRKRLPVRRAPTAKLPCWQCPKCQWSDENKTPYEGVKAELTAGNRAMIRMYYERQAAGGSVHPNCRRKFGVIAELLAEHERDRGRLLTELLKVRSGG